MLWFRKILSALLGKNNKLINEIPRSDSFSPVQSERKFSQIFGRIWAESLNKNLFIIHSLTIF